MKHLLPLFIKELHEADNKGGIYSFLFYGAAFELFLLFVVMLASIFQNLTSI